MVNHESENINDIILIFSIVKDPYRKISLGVLRFVNLFESSTCKGRDTQCRKMF